MRREETDNMENYEKNQAGAFPSQDPPSYSEKDPQPPLVGQLPPTHFVDNPAMPQQYQPYYAPYGGVPCQGSIIQQQHTTFVVPGQPTHEPDYLAYSIFTMLCCCLPLGIAALVYSIQTRDANYIGDSVAAQKSSRMAQIFAHTALVVGLVFLITYAVFSAVWF